MDLGLNKPIGGVFGGKDGPVWGTGPVLTPGELSALADRPHWRQPGTTTDNNKLTFYRDARKPQAIPQRTHVFMFEHRTYSGFKCHWSVGAGNRLPAGVSLDEDTGTLRYAREDNPARAVSPRTSYAVHAVYRSEDGRHVGHWTARVRIEVAAGTGGDEDAGGGEAAPAAGRPAENNSLGLRVYHGVVTTGFAEREVVNTTDAEARELMAAYPAAGLVIKANTLHPSVRLQRVSRAKTNNFGQLVGLKVMPGDLPSGEFRVHGATGEVVFMDEQENVAEAGDHDYNLDVLAHYAVPGSSTEVYTVAYQAPLRVSFVSDKAVPADVASSDGKTSDGEGATVTTHGAHLAWWVWLLGSVGAVLVLALLAWAGRRVRASRAPSRTG